VTFTPRVIAASLASLSPLIACLLWSMFFAADRWLVAAISFASLVLFIAVLRAQVEYPLRTIANVISALREEDYSIRVRGSRGDDAMDEVMAELNLLTDMLRERRLGEVEAAALVRSVFEHIDSAILTFDDRARVRLVNRSAERLLGRTADQLHGRSATDLGLDAFLRGDDMRNAELLLPGGHGRFRIRRTTFRESGVPHVLLSMSDLSRTLRDEERQAWQRLLRVLSHELNNSLAPIRSIAGSLATILARDPLPDGWQDDTQRGLGVITARAESLTRFLQSYSQLARLPQPVLRPMNVGDVVRRVAGLETRAAVKVIEGPDVTIHADRDQIEQVLINLVKNGVEAEGEVSMTWTASADAVEICVADTGSGISGTTNLFVPFFTTKPGGSGVGLTLARQIVEAHDGVLTLTDNAPKGTMARLRLRR
jgi:two-component system nitrogen regulation sensor histidine kinase NtrY